MTLGAVVAVALLMVASPYMASAKISAPSQIDMANDQCGVSSSPTTCQGGFTPNQTFRGNVSAGEVVTVFFMYLYGNSPNASLSFADNLGNTAVLVTSSCSGSTTIACTAAGFLTITTGGAEDISYTEHGGSTGEMWYNAELWQGKFNGQFASTGVSSSCVASCTGSLSLGPLTNSTSDAEVIAASAYVGFYPSTPATWQPTYFYSYQLTDSNPSGGDSVLWQATTSLTMAYSFSATTSPVPDSWAGSAELLYWTH